jgi:hypothetical protein
MNSVFLDIDRYDKKFRSLGLGIREVLLGALA